MAELIVALDVQTREEAVAAVKRIGDSVGFYKIGLELYTAEGPDVVKAVRDLGKKVFLDLKFHDIPRTVERAVRSGGKLGVDLMTIHSVGGKAMIAAAKAAALEFGEAAPKILAVTVLTSLDQADLEDVGITGRTPAGQVEAMARFAAANGADGLVCSPREVGNLSAILPKGMLFITPGVRPAGADVGDQKRIATPVDAVRDGSTHLVVGRPIMAAADPAAAARAILAEIAGCR
ncbi:MAG: orotidine-5'-phosphate decarboxylase [Kiritimatiellae bacterium]|nr:orotidine-5'-phosphate decarboxylase [Kiritimatiellia bacterium]